MITPDKTVPKTTPDQFANESTEQYHGDIRKGAYLKRRAAYQMQAGSLSPGQAGMLTRKNSKLG